MAEQTKVYDLLSAAEAGSKQVPKRVPVLSDIKDNLELLVTDPRAYAKQGLQNFVDMYIPTDRDTPQQKLEKVQNMFGAGGMAGKVKFAKPTTSVGKKAKQVPKKQMTVKEPVRQEFPGIYKSPQELAEEVLVAEENPLMKRLWGVDRADLLDISEHGARQGNITKPQIPGAAANPKGAASASRIMIPRNAGRLVDAQGYALDARPDLAQAMLPWYTMDPVYWRLEELLGPEGARAMYKRWNSATAMASAQATPITELRRGTAANWMHNIGMWDDFVRHGGTPAPQRTGTIGDMLRAVPGGVSHGSPTRGQSAAWTELFESGANPMLSPKIPIYEMSSGVPETGFQTVIPVGDAHFSRAVGLADVRTGGGWKDSVSVPEIQTLAPWWQNKVAGELGLESVPSQALAWGLYGPQTGVKYSHGLIGDMKPGLKPKLELLTDLIAETSRRLNISPEQARDMVITGKAHAGFVDPRLAAGVAALTAGGAAAPLLMSGDNGE